MKLVRIVNDSGLVYVERQFCRRWWFRVSPYYGSNIEAYNWVRNRRNVNLIKR